MKTISKIIAVAVLLIGTMTVFAQNYARYAVRLDKVFYAGAVVNEADALTFRDLGYGYAKDRNNVYWNGQVLPFVSPEGFRLHDGQDVCPPVEQEPEAKPGLEQAIGVLLGTFLGQVSGQSSATTPPPPPGHVHVVKEGYFVDVDVVLYNGVIVEEAHPDSFQELGNGYAIDDSHAFYAGQRIKGITSVNFRSIRDGYARNTNSIFYLGNKFSVTSPSSFKVLRDGYAKDSFKVYYCGVVVKNATASSFKILGDGYAQDSFRSYYKGEQIR